MAKYTNETFENKIVNIDDNSYVNCTFIKCQLIYSGGEIPELIGCSLENGSYFIFDGSASRTVNLLRAMYNGGFKSVVDPLIESIKTPIP